MHPKKVAVFTRRTMLARGIAGVLEGMEAQVEILPYGGDAIAGNTVGADTDLVVLDLVGATAIPTLKDITGEDSDAAYLLVVGPDMMPGLRIPVHVTCDFIADGASADEFAARIRRLVWPGEETATGDFIRQGPLTLNLATYQVKIDGEPVDFTYLEYALLAFLITHPGRTYSRDALLNRVWDFDYYGGSRTVDVHVRRIRAKLGPDLAQHLETVRGVGYLWNF